MLSEQRQQQEEAVMKKEAALRQTVEIPKEFWPSPENPTGEVMEDMQRQLKVMEGTLSHRKSLPDRELVRHASGGLALQGIYKTSDQRCLLEKKEELLCVPKEFVLCGPKQGTRVEMKEFTSSQEESMFTQTVEKLGFSITALAKGGGWGMSLEAGMDQSMHSESMKLQQSHSTDTYFCSTKFSYIPLASFHFPIDQLQISNAALQDLKYIEDLLSQSEDPDKLCLLKPSSRGLTATAGIKAVSPEEKTQRLALIKHHMGQSLTKEVVYVLTTLGGHDWENLEDLRLLIDGSYEAAVSSLQVEEKLLMLDYGLRYLIIKHEEYTENEVYSSTSNQEKEAFDPYEDLPEESVSPTKPSAATNVRPYVHPMDIQMAILHCADDFARQYILDKLSICQFALPLLIPNPCNAQIEFSLWSLSQIRRSWQQVGKSIKEEKDNYTNQQMCRVSAPIVSFIRVGTGFSASKSQIMNCLLSERKHDVFFHRHCKGSSGDCLLMGGVVEVAWFCPGGEEQDRFDNCLTFTNLHGDAKEHENQLAFLQEVSSVIVVLMSTSDDNKRN
ncbi:hypothetical protein MJT46_010120 [Ovis ammon polii x Ovis aries]|nr:hypothetical protein MJT46_010120 [Ovis ammon polii x Ovis aries]